MEKGKKYKTEINGFWFFGIYTDDHEDAAILTGRKMSLIVPKHECVGVDEPTSDKPQCNIPHVGSHRELLLAFLKSFESHDIELIKMGEYDEVIDGFLASN